MSVTVPTVPPVSADGFAPTSNAGIDLVPRFTPWLTLALAVYIDAIARMFTEIYDLVVEQGQDDGTQLTVGTYDQAGDLVVDGYSPGYTQVFSPATTDLLAGLLFISQWVGVQIPAGSDLETARSLTLGESGFKRGGAAAIIAAPKPFLTGTQSVILLERTNPIGDRDAYWFQLIVRPDELPWNLVPNPSAAHDAIGSSPVAWARYGTNSLGVVAAPVGLGQHALLAGYGNDLRLASIDTATVNAGDVRTISAYVFVTSTWDGGQITIGNDYATGGWTQSNTVSADMSRRDQWQRISCTVTAGSTPFSGGVFIRAASAPTSGDAINISNVQDVYGATLAAYADGDTGGWEWSGTPGDSSSRKNIQPLIDAVNAAKPAGTCWLLVQTDGWTISEMEAAYSTISDLEAAFRTITGLEGDVLGA